MMSFPNLPSQPSSGYQQRTAQPPHGLAPALAPSPQSTFYVRVQSLPTIGQGMGGLSDFCQHFAEVGTITYNWEPISTADVHELAALRIPVQVIRGAVASGMPLPTGNGPHQRTQPGTPQPRQVPIDGMRIAASRGPAFFNHGSQGRAPQPRPNEMGPGSYTGGLYGGRQIPEHNRVR